MYTDVLRLDTYRCSFVDWLHVATPLNLGIYGHTNTQYSIEVFRCSSAKNPHVDLLTEAVVF